MTVDALAAASWGLRHKTWVVKEAQLRVQTAAQLTVALRAARLEVELHVR